MEALLTALSPFIVSFISNKLKSSKMKFELGSERSLRRLGVRSIVAILSLGTAIGTALLAEGEIDVVSIDTAVQAVITFLGATGVYFFQKKITV